MTIWIFTRFVGRRVKKINQINNDSSSLCSIDWLSRYYESSRGSLYDYILTGMRVSYASSHGACSRYSLVDFCPSVNLSFCLSIRLSVCLSACLSIRPSVYSSVYLPVRSSVCLSVRPSVRIFACQSVNLYYVCISVRPSVYPSVCPSICLSVHLSRHCANVEEFIICLMPRS